MDSKHITVMFDSFLHEIKNPLSNIKGHVTLMESADPGLAKSEKWTKLKSNIQYMQELLTDFTTLNMNDLHVKSFDVPELLEGILEDYVCVFEEKDITLKYCPRGPLTYYGDDRKIRQALINLLKNAMEACEPGDEICMGYAWTNEHLDILVTDTGKGMTCDQLQTCTDAYTSYKEYGTGLGLVHVKWVMELHKGELMISSEKNQGSSFILRFPLEASC